MRGAPATKRISKGLKIEIESIRKETFQGRKGKLWFVFALHQVLLVMSM